MHSKKDSNVLLESYEAQAYNLTNMQDSNLLASNDDKLAYEILDELRKREKWEKLKTAYLNIYHINQSDIEKSKQRVGQKKLEEWVQSKDNDFKYEEEHFIKAEMRYYKIGGPIYNDVFIKNHIIISILVLHA